MKVEQLFKLRELLRKFSSENRACRAWIGFSGAWDHRRMFTHAHECVAVSRGNISPRQQSDRAISFTAFPVSCWISDNIGSNLVWLVCSEIPRLKLIHVNVLREEDQSVSDRFCWAGQRGTLCSMSWRKAAAPALGSSWSSVKRSLLSALNLSRWRTTERWCSCSARKALWTCTWLMFQVWRRQKHLKERLNGNGIRIMDMHNYHMLE